MTGLEAVTAVATYLDGLKQELFGDSEGRVFKYDDKEKGYSGQYIAVNNLPFVSRGAVGEGTINVNVHVPKLPKTEQADTRRLTQIVKRIVPLFKSEYGAYLDGAYFKHFSDGKPTPDNDGTYYVNIQLDCSFNNLSEELNS